MIDFLRGDQIHKIYDLLEPVIAVVEIEMGRRNL